MTTQGSPEELEHRRRLAVQRLTEGYSVEEVAKFLDVSPRTIWRWLALFRGHGPEGLRARPVQGKLLRDPNRKNHYSRNDYKKMRQMSEQARDKNA